MKNIQSQAKAESKWYNLKMLLDLGYSRNTIIKRFYGKDFKKYGVQWHVKRIKEKAVSEENYKKLYEGKLSRKVI